MARDHPVVVERMKEVRALALLYLLDQRTQAQHVGREDDLGAVAARRLDLGLRRGLRHSDRDLGPDRATGVRDRLCRVTGAHRHDPIGALGGGKAQDRVDGAARFERPRALEVFGLEEGSGADALTERPAREERGSGDVRGDDGAGAFDVRKRDRQSTLPRQWLVAGTGGPAWIRTKDQQIMSPPL